MEAGSGRRMSAGQRERQILETAKRVLASSNYRTATTARIAAEAGVTEPVIYRHFSSKKELFLGVLDDVARFMLDYWSKAAEGLEDPVEMIRAVGRSHFYFAREHKEEAKILFQATSEVDDPDIRGNLKGHFQGFALFMQALLDEGKVRGRIRDDLDTYVAAWELLALGITSTFFGLIGFEELLEGERGLRALEDFISMACGEGGAPPKKGEARKTDKARRIERAGDEKGKSRGPSGRGGRS